MDLSVANHPEFGKTPNVVPSNDTSLFGILPKKRVTMVLLVDTKAGTVVVKLVADSMVVLGSVNK